MATQTIDTLVKENSARREKVLDSLLKEFHKRSIQNIGYKYDLNLEGFLAAMPKITGSNFEFLSQRCERFTSSDYYSSDFHLNSAVKNLDADERKIIKFIKYALSLPYGEELDAILDASQTVSSAEPLAAKLFTAIMFEVPSSARSEYSLLVKNYFRNPRTLPTDQSNEGNIDTTVDSSSNEDEEPSRNYTGITGENETQGETSDLFGALRRILYGGPKKASSNDGKNELVLQWMKEANRLYIENPTAGLDLITSYIETILTYNQTGMGFERFISDLKVFGKPIYRMGDVIRKFEKLGQKRLSSLVGKIVSQKDYQTLDELIELPIYPLNLAIIYSKLDSKISDDELLQALRAPGDISKLWKGSDLSEKIFEKLLQSVNPKGSLASLLGKLDEIKVATQNYNEFIEEQDSLGDESFSLDETNRGLELYVCFLGKNIEQFIEDYRATGREFQNLPQVFDNLSKLFDEGKLKPIINYIAKSRSRRMLITLTQKAAPVEQTRSFINGLKSKLNKEEIVKLLIDFYQTANFLDHVKEPDRLFKAIGEPGEFDSEAAHTRLAEIRKSACAKVVGDRDIPPNLYEFISNLTVGYNADIEGIGKKRVKEETERQNILKFIATTYLDEGPEKVYSAIMNLKGNSLNPMRNLLACAKRGIGLDSTTAKILEKYKQGVERTYKVTTQGEIERIKGSIDTELLEIYGRLKEIGIDENSISELKTKGIREQLEGIEKAISPEKIAGEKAPLRTDIKARLQVVKSQSGKIKDKSEEVRFYVCKDPLEALMMGTFFNSCLTMGDCNDFGAIIHTADSNKNVIYAKNSNGQVIGRNRTVLTDQGILLTRFYHSGNLSLDKAWVDYLTDYATEVGLPVMIPNDFIKEPLKEVLEQRCQERKAKEVNRKLILRPGYLTSQPGHFNSWYSDDLPMSKRFRHLTVKFDGYAILPAGKSK